MDSHQEDRTLSSDHVQLEMIHSTGSLLRASGSLPFVVDDWCTEKRKRRDQLPFRAFPPARRGQQAALIEPSDEPKLTKHTI